MKKDPIATRITQKLQNVAKKTGQGLNDLIRMYLLERLVARIYKSDSKVKDLVLKGGFVSERIYGTNRYTKDVDISTNTKKLDIIEPLLINEIKKDISDGVTFDINSISKLYQVEGTRLNIEAQIGSKDTKAKAKRHISVDLVEAPVLQVQTIESGTLIDEESISLKVCSAEVTVSEKLLCLVTRAEENTRTKDVWDLLKMLENIDPEAFATTLEKTFSAANQTIPENFSEFVVQLKKDKLASGWKKLQVANNNTTFTEAIQKIAGNLARLESTKSYQIKISRGKTWKKQS